MEMILGQLSGKVYVRQIDKNATCDMGTVTKSVCKVLQDFIDCSSSFKCTNFVSDTSLTCALK